MRKEIVIWAALLLAGVICALLAMNIDYFYLSLLLTNTEKYPTGLPLENMAIYQFDPQTVLSSLARGNVNVFFPAQENPIYDDVQPLAPPASFPWSQEDALQVTNTLHQFVWRESLEQWHLYSMSFAIPKCNDISRIDGAGFQFYKRLPKWYYLVHTINLDLEYGYIYVGDNNGHYTGQWKDVEIEKSQVNTFGKALAIAEQNGGQSTRLAISNNQNCYITVNYPIGTYVPSKWVWEITYWVNDGNSIIYKILIDPFTSSYEIPVGN